MCGMKTINGSRRLRSARIDAAHRAQIVSAFENGGLSAAAFVRQHGLNYTTFYSWRQRQRKVKSLPAFVQVEVAAPAARVELVIELGRTSPDATPLRKPTCSGHPPDSPPQRGRVMLSFHAHLKVFVATVPCDLRMNFNGLWTAAQQHLGKTPRAARSLSLGTADTTGSRFCILTERVFVCWQNVWRKEASTGRRAPGHPTVKFVWPRKPCSCCWTGWI